MRQLKFRVWFYHQKKFLYGGLEMFSKLSFPLDWCAVQQFTGLKDKNGREIYEGDILSWGSEKYQIIWGDTAGVWWAADLPGDGKYGLELYMYPKAIVIGNIFELDKS